MLGAKAKATASEPAQPPTEEAISHAGHKCLREAEALNRHCERLRTTPVTKADVLLGAIHHGIGFEHYRTTLAVAKAVLDKVPQATFTYMAQPESLKAAVETLHSAIQTAEVYERVKQS